jgi:hypothetical protein
MDKTPMHTPGPWAVTKGRPRKVTANGVLICNAVFKGYNEEAEANARRIVACVNACNGVPTASLENGVVLDLIAASTAFNFYDSADDDDGVKMMLNYADAIEKTRDALAKLGTRKAKATKP